MPEEGHVRRLLPLVAGVVAAGAPALVYTHERFRPEVDRAGGTFVDLFRDGSVDDADPDSMPVPCRFVTFAARQGDALVRALERSPPRLVVCDTFCVIGRVAAARLRVPFVNVCAGHDVDPAAFVRRLRSDPRVRVSPRCLEAVDVLRERDGLADASPFSYVDGNSPHLNVYGEPPEYLSQERRRALAPVAFFGCLPDGARTDPDGHRRPGDGRARAYVSFGTVVWRYYADEALAALEALSAAFARRPEWDVLVSVGGTDLDGPALRRVARDNVTVARYVDQWSTLGGVDLFVTHQGLNSTHEAVFHRVPMVSYPFFWDQPALSRRCRELGLSVPLTEEEPRAAVTPRDAETALDAVHATRASMQERLAEARDWELRVLARRGDVVARLLALA